MTGQGFSGPSAIRATGSESSLKAKVAADQDSVRLLAVEGCGHFSRLLRKEESTSTILPVVQRFATVSGRP